MRIDENALLISALAGTMLIEQMGHKPPQVLRAAMLMVTAVVLADSLSRVVMPAPVTPTPALLPAP